MGFTVPNGPDAANADQSEPDAVDFRILGDRRTGVISGCAVTAQVVPDMTVAVSAGQVVVDGEPVAVAGGNATIQVADANPRFDLVLVSAAGALSVLRGTASATNPVFPVPNLSTHAVLAAVYVGASTSSITSNAIVDKRIQLEPSMRASYSSDDETVIDSTAPSGRFRLFTSGKMQWANAVLQRIGTTALELSGQLDIKTPTGSSTGLVVKARSDSPENQVAFAVQTSAGAARLTVYGDGTLEAGNFLRGAGSPLGTVAPTGTLYVDKTAPRNGALWICEAPGQWSPFRTYDPSDDGVPVGTLLAYLGEQGAEPPGYVGAYGQSISDSDPETAELASLIGNRYGSGPGTKTMPDFRGRIPIGVGGEVALTIGQVIGTATATLTLDNLPEHSHPVTDPGHVHPQAGDPLYYAPGGGAFRPSSDGDAPFGISVDTSGVDNRRAATGVEVGVAGEGAEFSVLPPVHAINWIVKAHATYARISQFSGETLIPVNQSGATVYMTISEFQNSVITQAELDGRYAPLASSQKATAAQALGDVIAWDTFDRPDGEMGSLQSGQPWTGISFASVFGGRAGRTPTGTGRAFVDLGAPLNGSIEATLYGGSVWATSSVGLYIRTPAAAVTNSLLVWVGSNVRLERRVADVGTTLASAAHGILDGQPARLCVEVDGAVIRVVLKNMLGQVTASFTHTLTGGDETTFASGQFVGFVGFHASSPTSIDDFVVRSY